MNSKLRGGYPGKTGMISTRDKRHSLVGNDKKLTKEKLAEDRYKVFTAFQGNVGMVEKAAPESTGAGR